MPPPTKLDTYTIFKRYFGAHIFRKWRTPKSSARIGMSKRGEIAFLLLCIPRNLVVSLFEWTAELVRFTSTYIAQYTQTCSQKLWTRTISMGCFVTVLKLAQLSDGRILLNIILCFSLHHSLWANDGVKEVTTEASSKRTVCQTNHFTSFAVLIQYQNTQVWHQSIILFYSLLFCLANYLTFYLMFIFLPHSLDEIFLWELQRVISNLWLTFSW